MGLKLWLVVAEAVAAAEIIDRIAVTVDRQIITASAIAQQIRITAFLNREPLDLGPVSRRRMAERLVEQLLIRREMEISLFPMPASREAASALAEIRKERGAEEFARELVRYGVSEQEVVENLVRQMAAVRFIDLRFRPGIAAGDSEIEEYYRGTFIPQWRKENSTPPPEVDEVRDQIGATLLEQKVNQALDRWLKDARGHARIRFFEEAFR